VATARRRRVSLAAATLAAVGTLAVGFGAGYLVRKATATTTTTTAPTTSTSTSTSTTAVPLAVCTGSELTGALSSSQAATGTIQSTAVLTNHAPASCKLSGFPTVLLLGANSTALTTTVVHQQATFSSAEANAAPSAQRLTPGGTVSFMLQYSQIPTSEAPCPTSSSMNVGVPGSSVAVNVVAKMMVCDEGTVHVSPLYGGT
jgi:Protein of unknown function (DUF4232)